MRHKVTWLILWSVIALWSPKSISNDVSLSLPKYKNSVSSILDNFNYAKQYNEILDDKISNISWITQGQKQEIKAILDDENLKTIILNVLKKEKAFTLSSIIISLISVLIYLLAYNWNFKKVKEWHETSTVTYLNFAFSSSLWLYLTWIEPWTLILLVSAVSASYIAYKNHDNIKNSKTVTQKTQAPFIEIFENIDFPVVRYNKEWKPILWNKKMEEETWYCIKEVLDYFEKNSELMSLLYKWKNLDKVNTYLNEIEKTWKWYKNVAFTMNTKSWDEKTFLWTTLADWNRWTIRTARLLVDKIERDRELEETKKLLRIDSLTQALNKNALEQDLKDLIIYSEINDDFKDFAYVILDIDNFKSCNDKYWHIFWDKVLEQLSKIIFENIRWDDKIYRIWWDEFVIIFNTNDLWSIIKKIDKIRKDFELKEFINKWEIVSWIWTSWWVKKIDFQKIWKVIKNEESKIIDELKDETDAYMYAVKYLQYIKDELVKRWINENSIPQKNAIWYPVFDTNSVFIWVNVLSNKWNIFITKEEFRLLEIRKKSIDSNNMRKI